MNQTATEVQTIPEKQALIKFSISVAAINKMAKKWAKVPDVSTKEGYALAQQAKRELTPMRTAITKEMDIQKEAAQIHIKGINLNGNKLVDKVRDIEAPIYNAKKAQDEKVAKEARDKEEAEERRTLEIEGKIEEIQALTENLLGADLEKIEGRLAEANAITISDDIYMEFVEAASLVLSRVKDQLTNAVDTATEQAKQQVVIDAQQKDIENTQRKQKLQESIGRIRMAPVDLIGSNVADMQAAIDKLGNIDVVTIYADLADDANAAINDTKAKLESMIVQQQGMDDQQEELNRQNFEREQDALKEQQAADDKAKKEQKAADDKANEAELKARMPDDVRLREFATELMEIEVPLLEYGDDYLITVRGNVLTKLAGVANYINDNTQDPA